MRAGRRTFLLLLSGALACGGQVWAQAVPSGARSAGPPAPRVRLFNIPAQPLASALLVYSNVVGNQIIYDSRLAAGGRSSPVVGLFTPDTALRMLLEGTDLTVRHTASQDVILVSTSAMRAESAAGASGGEAKETMVLDTLYVDAPPGAEERPDFSDYGRMVRSQVKQALITSPETARRIYAVKVELWVDARGRIERSRLAQSSGRPQLDEAIQHVIEAVLVRSPPPQGMPQPIHLTILGI